MSKRIYEKRKKIIPRVGILILAVFLTLFVIKAVQVLPILYELFFKQEITLKKTNERVNILLLGIGGGKHDGPNLTDTIIFASIDPKKKTVSLVSIPRDFWVPDFNAKINTAYALGENKQKGGGLLLTKAIVEKILGQNVDYALRVDFTGFVRAVDMIGGLNVTVDRNLDDYEYPIDGKETDTCGFEQEEFEKRATAASQLDAFPCRYEHLYFEKGLQHMDGETALRFVRSRHATGAEGTDFARSQRQEKIIQAFKDKVFSAGTFLNPIRVVSLYDIFKDSIDTDIKQEEYDDFIKLARKMENAQVHSAVLDEGDPQEKRNGLLTNPIPSKLFDNQWVIIPRRGSGNYTEIHSYAQCVIE